MPSTIELESHVERMVSHSASAVGIRSIRWILVLTLWVTLLPVGLLGAQAPGKPQGQTQTEAPVTAPETRSDDAINTAVKGLGNQEAPANRITGQVLGADGQPAAKAIVRVVGHSKSDINATVVTTDTGQFDFVLRCASNALPQVRVWAESESGTQSGFHRWAWEDKDRVTEGIQIKLQSQRVAEVEVVDASGKPVQAANVALRLQYPHSLQGFLTDQLGKAIIKLPERERIEEVIAWKDQAGLDYRLYSLGRNQKADVKAVAPEFPSGQPERLVLDGTAPLTVKVVDDAGKSISGVSLYPWLLQKDNASDSLNLSFVADTFSQDSNADGETTFEWMPAWQKSLVTVWPVADGYERPRGNYDPTNGNGLLMIKLNRLVPIRGRVLDVQGLPAEGIEVSAQGTGRSFNQFSGSVRTDAAGKYELLVAPNQVYIVTVRDDVWVAAPQTGFAVFPNQPLDGRDFQLRQPTRVYGRLLNERTQEPIPQERVIVYQYGTGLHELEGVELPNPDNERYVVQPIVQYYATTNAQGEFEFLLGNGKFDLRPPRQEKAEAFEIAGQAELKMSVATKVQEEVELAGIVIAKNVGTPIEGAKLTGVPRSFSGMDWKAETGKDGKFKVLRRKEPTYVHAVNADKSLAAIVEVGDTKNALVIQLQPVGTARGRLVNRDKKPVAGQRIDFGVDVPDVENRTWSNRFGGHVITDIQGQFELTALAAGWEYRLSFPATAEGTIPRLTTVIVKPEESKDVGDITEPAPVKRNAPR